MERFTVLLAVPSPLYAPLYLAKVKRYTCFDRIDFDYAGAPVGNADPLLDRVLAVAGRRRTVMAVGDPMRILSTSPMDNHDTPLVVGGLVTHMCYWALDGKTRVSRHEAYWDKIVRIVAHPIGMTAYAVLFHDMVKRGAFEAKSHDVTTYDKIDEYIIDKIAPGFEKEAYEQLCEGSKKTGQSYGFLTMDPADYIRVVNSGEHPIRSFIRDEPYRDVVMTGLITGNELWAGQRGLIDDIREGIANAVRDIQEAPEYAAYLLQSYYDQRFRIASRYDEELLANSLTVLADAGAYSPDLKITGDQVRKSKDVRAPAEKLLCERLLTPERAEREKRFEDLESFFHLEDPVTPPSKRESYSVVRDLLADRNVRQRGGSNSRSRTEKFVLVMSCVLLLIAFLLSRPKLEEFLHTSSVIPPHQSGNEEVALGVRVVVALLALLGGMMPVYDVGRVSLDGVQLSVGRITTSFLLMFSAIYLFVDAAFVKDIGLEITGTVIVMAVIALFVHHWRTGAFNRIVFELEAWRESRHVNKQIKKVVATERAARKRAVAERPRNRLMRFLSSIFVRAERAVSGPAGASAVSSPNPDRKHDE